MKTLRDIIVGHYHYINIGYQVTHCYIAINTLVEIQVVAEWLAGWPLVLPVGEAPPYCHRPLYCRSGYHHFHTTRSHQLAGIIVTILIRINGSRH